MRRKASHLSSYIVLINSNDWLFLNALKGLLLAMENDRHTREIMISWFIRCFQISSNSKCISCRDLLGWIDDVAWRTYDALASHVCSLNAMKELHRRWFCDERLISMQVYWSIRVSQLIVVRIGGVVRAEIFHKPKVSSNNVLRGRRRSYNNNNNNKSRSSAIFFDEMNKCLWELIVDDT